jgi:pimeloyl-ACP methyl ester carboxylesterase
MKIELLSRKPDKPTHATPILFVHGAWHGAWCWEKFFLPYFAGQGWEVHALSLRGHGKSEGRVRWASGQGYVADVAQAVGEIGKQPIVVGHSMGGYVVQKYLEKHPAPAAVLLASIPSAGILRWFLRGWLQHPLLMLQVTVTLDPYVLVSTPERARESFFSADMPRDEVQTYYEQLQSESFRIIFDSLLLDLPRPGRITTPMLVLGAENDRIFHVPEHEATARAYHTQAEIFPNMAHDMMLESGWQSVADRIIAWLSERNL